MTTDHIAKAVVARGIKRHPATDGHAWAVRHITVEDAGNVLEQPITSYEDESIYPIVSEINEYEAANIGQNARAGDLRLIVDGFLEIDERTLLVCDGEKCDIFQAPAAYYDGGILSRIIMVRRPKERTDV